MSISINSQRKWQDKTPEKHTQQRLGRDYHEPVVHWQNSSESSNSNSKNEHMNGGVVGDDESTISHSATLISHHDNPVNGNNHYSKNDEQEASGSDHANGAHAKTDPGARSDIPAVHITRVCDETEISASDAESDTETETETRTTPRTPRTRRGPTTTTRRRRANATMTKVKDVVRRKVLSRIATELENTGSTARDHLANERTWLAYVRTSLAIAGTGVALVQLFTISTNQEGAAHSNSALQRAARPLGATTVMTGVFVLCVGIFRYFFVQSSMMRGQFPVARTTVVAISTIIAALAAVLFGLLIGLKN